MKAAIRRWGPWAATVLGLALLVAAGAMDRNRGRATKPASNLGVGQTIDYLIRREEWSASPNYCDIARRFELSPNQIVATRYLNGTNGECADPLSVIPIGQKVQISLAEMPGSTCKATVSSC